MNNKQPDKSPAERAIDDLRDFADILAAPEGSLVIYKAGPVVRHGLIVTVEQSGVWFDGGCAPVPFSDILYIIPDPADFVGRVQELCEGVVGDSGDILDQIKQSPGSGNRIAIQASVVAHKAKARIVQSMIQGGV